MGLREVHIRKVLAVLEKLEFSFVGTDVPSVCMEDFISVHCGASGMP